MAVGVGNWDLTSSNPNKAVLGQLERYKGYLERQREGISMVVYSSMVCPSKNLHIPVQPSCVPCTSRSCGVIIFVSPLRRPIKPNFHDGASPLKPMPRQTRRNTRSFPISNQRASRVA